jgi:hypothetical protein
MIRDDELLTVRVTTPGGCPDDYQVIWRGVPIGRIMQATGFPSQDTRWSWGCNVYGLPSLGGSSGHGDDLNDCKAMFMASWTRIRSRLTEADIAKAHGLMRG